MSDRDDLSEIARSLRAVLAKLNRRLRAQDDSVGVGTTGLSLLSRLLRDGPSTAAVLATQERLQPQSLTRALQALEAHGMIKRVADAADRRRSTITITPIGIETLRTTARGREEWLVQAMSATLSATEREMLRVALALFERLADADE